MNSFHKSPELNQDFLPLTAEGHHLHFSTQKEDFKHPVEQHQIAKVTIDPRMLVKAGSNQQPLLLQEHRHAFSKHPHQQQPKPKKREAEKSPLVESSPTEDMSRSTQQTGSKNSAQRAAYHQNKYTINDNGQLERIIRKRKRKSGDQLKTLVREFEKNPNWSKESLLEISKKSGLSEAQIYKWGWD